jgi:hypothetical protein
MVPDSVTRFLCRPAGNRRLRFEPLEHRHLLAAVTSFTLINSDTDIAIGPLTSGQTINLAELPTTNLNVVAGTVDAIGSVRFDFDGQAGIRTENSSPYSLFGDQDGDYKPGSFALGSHTLIATPFSRRNAAGTPGTPLSVTFTVTNQSQPTNQPPTANAGPDHVVTLPTNAANLDGTVLDDNFPGNPLTTTWSVVSGAGTATFGNASSVDTTVTFGAAGVYLLRLTADDGQFARSDDVQITVHAQPTGPGIVGFTLINAVTDQPMFAIEDGTIIDLTELATTKVNIRANTSGSIGSVAFDYDAATNIRIDSQAPYGVFSETAGNFSPVILGLGNHTLTARAFTGSGGGGSLINARSLNFQVVVGQPIPDQIHLSWTADPPTSFTIVWRTFNTATASAAQYRRLGDTDWLDVSGTRKASGTTGTLHQAAIVGLLPSTQYEYRVSGDGGVWSDAHATKTAPPRGPADFDFVYFADTGLVGRTDGLSTGTQQIIDDIAALKPLLLLGGGDYAYYNTDKRFGPLEAHIDAWFNQSAAFLTQSVFMPTLGNHEVRLNESYDAWIARMALPASQIDNFNVYSFDVGPVHFVSILAVLGKTGLPDSQVDWIIQDVQDAQARGQTWIIPYMHVSAFSDGTSHPSNVGLRNQLGPVFEQLGVHLVISSHDQNYERTYPLVNVGQGNPVVTDNQHTGYDAEDGIVWLKVSPAGKLSNVDSAFSEFRTNPPPYWTAARDDTMHHFARFSISADGTLTTRIYATPGQGTPSFVQDTFTYSLGNSPLSQVVLESRLEVKSKGDRLSIPNRLAALFTNAAAEQIPPPSTRYQSNSALEPIDKPQLLLMAERRDVADWSAAAKADESPRRSVMTEHHARDLAMEVVGFWSSDVRRAKLPSADFLS